MKIGIYDPYLDDVGGGEKYMMSIASFLSKNHDVTVFWDRQEDLNVISNRFALDLSQVKRAGNIFSAQVGLIKRLFLSKGYDGILVLSDGSIPLVASKKLILHVQQPLFHTQTQSILGKLKLSRVSTIFSNSEFTKLFVDKSFQRPTIVIYPPVELKPKKVKKENIILHVGRFRVKNVSNSDYKKQGVMISVFKKMVDNGLEDWRFILAVSIQEKDKVAFLQLQERAKGYPIEFLVNNTNDELWDVYSKAKIYWHASGYGEDLSTHPEYAEHFGISTVEAMGAGVVPVVIHAGGQKEIITNGKNGLLWSTLEELQQQTQKIIKDMKLWEKLSKNAQKRAKDFSKEKFEKQIEELIR